jgi:CheY-specific phosphatase CheX
VCEAMLGLTPEVEAETGAEVDDAAELAGPAGRVGFAGAWSGSVVVRCDPGFAHACAAILLADEACEDAAVDDALGELTNMIAGNLKAVLPAPTRMSLPCVIAARPTADTVPESAPGVALAHVGFRLPSGERLSVAVWRNAAPPHTHPPDRGSTADIPG